MGDAKSREAILEKELNSLQQRMNNLLALHKAEIGNKNDIISSLESL